MPEIVDIETVFDNRFSRQFGFPITSGESTEVDLLPAGGKNRTAEMRVVEIEWDDSPAYLALIRDITERKRREAQFKALSAQAVAALSEAKKRADELRKSNDELRRTQEKLGQSLKMEAIGRLAGGVAHDFNNLLMAVQLHCELCLAQLPLGDSIRDEITQITEIGKRATRLTQQLLAFGRKQVLKPSVLDLNKTVSDMGKLLRRLIGEDIELLIVPRQGLWQVEADPRQLEQIIVNLAVNARDAMPKGGKLLIETDKVELNEDYAREHEGVRAGPYALLAVSDTGCGMDGTLLGRVFEPFFTTKEVGKGTGLGLSTVYGIVKQSGGHIRVYSEPGKGTTFKIYLRSCEKKLETPEAEKAWVAKRDSSGRILLAEDEWRVRKVVCNVLKRSGYTVLEAASGKEALEICREHKGQIDLLLTDVVMPEMSGRELANRLVNLFPGIRVLYLSGYTEDAIAHHGVLDPGTAFLQKPVSSQVLREKVRKILGA